MPCQTPDTSFVPLQATRYQSIIQINNFNKNITDLGNVNKVESSSHVQECEKTTYSEPTAAFFPLGSMATHLAGTPFTVVNKESSSFIFVRYLRTSVSSLVESQQSSFKLN